MRFDLAIFAPRVQSHSLTWDALDLAWSLRPVYPNHGKAMTGASFENGDWVAELLIWESGELELETVRLGDRQAINKHYELTAGADLDVVIDELVSLLRDGKIRPGAYVP